MSALYPMRRDLGVYFKCCVRSHGRINLVWNVHDCPQNDVAPLMWKVAYGHLDQS